MQGIPPYDEGPVPAREGTLGECSACKKAGATHFDTKGKFVGCTAASPGMVFALVPIQATRASAPTTVHKTRRTRGPRVREFTRARYFASLPTGKSLDRIA